MFIKAIFFHTSFESMMGCSGEFQKKISEIRHYTKKCILFICSISIFFRFIFVAKNNFILTSIGWETFRLC